MNIIHPKCPKCGSPMVVRVSAKGKHPGNRFFGCSNFPKCWKILPMGTDMVSKEVESSMTKEMKIILDKELELFQNLVNDIWRLEKKEKAPLRMNWNNLSREITFGIKGNDIHKQTHDQRDAASMITQWKKERAEIEKKIEAVREVQMKKLKEIELIINV